MHSQSQASMRTTWPLEIQFLHAQSVWFRGHSSSSQTFFFRAVETLRRESFCTILRKELLGLSLQILLCAGGLTVWNLIAGALWHICTSPSNAKSIAEKIPPKHPVPVKPHLVPGSCSSSVQTHFWRDGWSPLETFSNQRATFLSQHWSLFPSCSHFWIICSWKLISLGLSNMKVGLWSRAKHGELWLKRNVFIKARNNRSKGVKLTTNTMFLNYCLSLLRLCIKLQLMDKYQIFSLLELFLLCSSSQIKS